jgi:PAS domain S-box-containing protein
MKSKSNGRAAAAKGKVGQPSRGNIFEQMIENSPLNFIRADSDMIIRYINPASRTTLAKVAQLLPCKVEDVVGSNIDIFHKNPAHQRRMMADPRNLPHRVDIRLGPETLNLILSAIYDDAKNYTGALVCWEIVTERVREAADNVGQLAAIGKSQAVIEFKMDGTIVTANENFLHAMGYTLEEIKGKHHSLFVEEGYRQSAAYREFWAKLNRGEYEAGEFKRIGKGGKEVWIQASYNPILDGDGKPFKVVKYVEQISKGDIPPQITDTYNGDFNLIKNNLNTLIVAMNEITAAAEEIANGNLTVDAPRAFAAGQADAGAGGDGERADADGLRHPLHCRRGGGCQPVHLDGVDPGVEGRQRAGGGGRRGLVLDGGDGFQHQAECRQRAADRQDRQQERQGCAGERQERSGSGGRDEGDRQQDLDHRGDCAPDQPAGAERGH